MLQKIKKKIQHYKRNIQLDISTLPYYGYPKHEKEPQSFYTREKHLPNDIIKTCVMRITCTCIMFICKIENMNKQR